MAFDEAPDRPPWTTRLAARLCKVLVLPMAGATGVALTRLGSGRAVWMYIAAAITLTVLSFAGPGLMLRAGRAAGVIAVATAQLLGCLGALPGMVPASVVPPHVFKVWLLFTPISLTILIVLWLPSSTGWLEERRNGPGQAAPAPAETTDAGQPG